MNSTDKTNRVIRVFISSTFRDMMRERDLLVKEVFPELRRKCAKRFVTLTEVDLRWGITEAQANEGHVLPLCLAEIERSRPYFIGLIGERYGWIPDSIRPEIIEREPWLLEHVQGRTSVTELEILHGVLNAPKMKSHALFFFRAPAYANDPALTDDERWDMVEHDISADVEQYGQAEATRRTEERKTRLAGLKQHIRDSQLSLVEPYANPAALAEIVREQFDKLIDRLYPEEHVPDPLEQERMAHEAHAKNKLFACIDRPAHLAALNAFASPADHLGAGLVVTGESGGGKTALLAAWARDWARNHPEDFLFQYYFGATPDSVSPEGFLRRLLGELKGRFGILDDIPINPEELRDTLPLWLAQTTDKGRIVLVLDGINQVQGSEPDRRLNFLPRHFPPHVVAIASSLPGPALEAVTDRGWAKHDLPRASEPEVDDMAGEYLRIHARTLEPGLRHELVNAPGAKTPLFLRTVLDELRQFGSFDKLPARVRFYLHADNPKDLFLRVIQRWQEDFDAKDPDQDNGRVDLVRRTLTCLWAARQGLSEPEWLDLLGDGSEPLPRALFTPLFLALEPNLSQHGGLFAFGHDFLGRAVETAFVPSEDLQQAVQLSVANYFEHHEHQREMSPRKASEWPHQLHAAQAWGRLEACLTDLPLFLALYNDKTKWELTVYWHPLRKQGLNMGTCYEAAYRRRILTQLNETALLPLLKINTEPRWNENPVGFEDPQVLAAIGAFLLENGLYPPAETMLTRALDVTQRELGPEHIETLGLVNNLASLFERTGRLSSAEPLLHQALEDNRRIQGPEHRDTLHNANNLAHLLYRKGDYAGAEPLFRQTLRTRERVLGLKHPDTLVSANNLASLLECKGDHAGAEQLYHRALDANEQILGPDHPTTLASVHNLASLLSNKGRYATAESLLSRVLETCERILGPEHPHTLTAVNSMVHLLLSKGDYKGAEPLIQQALEVSQRILGVDHLCTLELVNTLALLLYSKGDYHGAKPLYVRALQAREEVLSPEHPLTLATVNNLALLLVAKGEFVAAEQLYRRALEAGERVLGPEHPQTLAYATNLADLLDRPRLTEEAFRLRVRGVELRERSPGAASDPHLAINLNNLNVMARRLGHVTEAESFARRALAADENTRDAAHPIIPHRLNNLCTVLTMQGKLDEAKGLLDRAWKLKSSQHDIVSARVLFVRLTVALLESKPGNQFIGQLKTLLLPEPLTDHAGVAKVWDIADVIEYLRPKLLTQDPDFLKVLATALDDRTKLDDLDRLPEWRCQSLIPLDIPWPD